MDKVLTEFQKFYRRNSEAWLQRYEYRESAHHLLLMAFLQRIINTGGDIIREMALGNERIDMLVRFGRQEFALELKVSRDSHTLEDGQEQLARYLDKLRLKQGYLVIFDLREKSWEEKIYRRELECADKNLILIGV